MPKFKRKHGYVAMVGAVFAIVSGGVALDRATTPASSEDSPGWNCHTQGNRVCGPAAYPSWEQPTTPEAP